MGKTIRYYEAAKREGVYIQRTAAGYEVIVRSNGLVCFSGKVHEKVRGKMNLYRIPVFDVTDDPDTDLKHIMEI